MDRRRFLETAGLALGTVVAGCTAEPGAPGDGDPSPSGTPSGATDPSTSTPTSTATATPTSGMEPTLVDVETIQFATTTERPSWFDAMGETVGDVIVIDDRDRTGVIWPHDMVAPDRRQEVADFLEDGSFEDSVLLYVASAGPDACHRELAVSDVRLEGGELHARAEVATADEDVCAEVLTFPSALVRATFDGQPVTDATVTVVDGWGNEAAISATAGDPLPTDPDDLSGYVRPEGDPATVPSALSCDRDDVERLQSWVDEGELPWGETPIDPGTATFALRVDRPNASLGETVEVALTNLTDEDRATGNRWKHAIQVYTEAGWQDVRVHSTDGGVGYTDEAIVHSPGEGFTWSLELTESGLLDGHPSGDSLEVCPELGAGRYRFVFFEPAVAVAFDVTA